MRRNNDSLHVFGTDRRRNSGTSSVDGKYVCLLTVKPNETVVGASFYDIGLTGRAVVDTEEQKPYSNRHKTLAKYVPHHNPSTENER